MVDCGAFWWIFCLRPYCGQGAQWDGLPFGQRYLELSNFVSLPQGARDLDRNVLPTDDRSAPSHHPVARAELLSDLAWRHPDTSKPFAVELDNQLLLRQTELRDSFNAIEVTKLVGKVLDGQPHFLSAEPRCCNCYRGHSNIAVVIVDYWCICARWKTRFVGLVPGALPHLRKIIDGIECSDLGVNPARANGGLDRFNLWQLTQLGFQRVRQKPFSLLYRESAH
ncbi:hypothetical protein D3C77_455140 [compost metagenome]